MFFEQQSASFFNSANKPKWIEKYCTATMSDKVKIYHRILSVLWQLNKYRTEKRWFLSFWCVAEATNEYWSINALYKLLAVGRRYYCLLFSLLSTSSASLFCPWMTNMAKIPFWTIFIVSNDVQFSYFDFVFF